MNYKANLVGFFNSSWLRRRLESGGGGGRGPRENLKIITKYFEKNTFVLKKALLFYKKSEGAMPPPAPPLSEALFMGLSFGVRDSKSSALSLARKALSK